MQNKVGLDSAGESFTTEVENPNGRIINPGFASLPFNGKPDMPGDLSCKLMECKGRNQAYNALRNPFGGFGKADFGRHFHFSKLKKPSRYRYQCTLIPKAIQGSSMDAAIQGFGCPQKAALAFKDCNSFFSGRFHGA